MPYSDPSPVNTVRRKMETLRRRIEALPEMQRAPLNEAVAALAAKFEALAARRTFEAQAQRLHGELAHASRLSILGGLTSGLAHELNQPLTAILGYAQSGVKLLQREGDSDRALLIEALESIAEQSRRAQKVIRRMREFGRLRDNQRGWADMNGLLREVLVLVEKEAGTHRIDLRVEPGGDLPAVLMDRIQIQQVILNLLVNAIRALQDYSERRRIRVRTWAAEGEIVLSVSSTGPTTRQEAIARLLEPFSVAEPDELGMDLEISRAIVEAHGGRLWVIPNPGGGIDFRFALPYEDRQR